MTNPFVWSDREKVLLNAILGQIIPANTERGIPSAASLGLADHLAMVATEDPALAIRFREGLASADALAGAIGEPFEALDSDHQVTVLRQLEQSEPAFFELLLRHTYMGYYSRPDIRSLFGPSSNPVHPDGYDVSRESPELMAELTEPVRRRGSLYRAC